jgi:hypothetical protein
MSHSRERPREFIGIGPHTYEFIRSNIPFDLLSLLGKGFLILFPSAHPLHTPSCTDCNFGMPTTIYFRDGKD